MSHHHIFVRTHSSQPTCSALKRSGRRGFSTVGGFRLRPPKPSHTPHRDCFLFVTAPLFYYSSLASPIYCGFLTYFILGETPGRHAPHPRSCAGRGKNAPFSPPRGLPETDHFGDAATPPSRSPPKKKYKKIKNKKSSHTIYHTFCTFYSHCGRPTRRSKTRESRDTTFRYTSAWLILG